MPFKASLRNAGFGFVLLAVASLYRSEGGKQCLLLKPAGVPAPEGRSSALQFERLSLTVEAQGLTANRTSAN